MSWGRITCLRGVGVSAQAARVFQHRQHGHSEDTHAPVLERLVVVLVRVVYCIGRHSTRGATGLLAGGDTRLRLSQAGRRPRRGAVFSRLLAPVATLPLPSPLPSQLSQPANPLSSPLPVPPLYSQPHRSGLSKASHSSPATQPPPQARVL